MEEKREETNKQTKQNISKKKTCKRKKTNNNNQKKNKMKKKKNTYSLPPLHERSETPGTLHRHDWESQEANLLPRTVLSASVRITGYLHSGCRRGCQESICVRGGPFPDSIIGEAHVQNPSLQQTRHPYFPPKLCSNSIFKPKPAETPAELHGRLGYSQYMLTTMI